MADTPYQPGANALLVFHDEQGITRMSVVEIVRKNDSLSGTPWYVVTGNQDVFSMNNLVVPLDRAQIDVKEGYSVAMVREDQLAPAGTRNFRIIQ